MQSQGCKIQHLAKEKGVKQLHIAKHIGWTKSGFSRKVNGSQRFSPKELAEIAAFLGVTPQFLMDESIEYIEGQPIPPDALATPQLPQTQQLSELASEVELMFARHYERMNSAKAAQSALPADAIAEMIVRLSSAIDKLSEEVRELREEREGGEHDPD